ncbi:adenosylcobinamide-phosphate synthase CbiB [Methanotorris igneus]|uniref:Probable cobalamin biosynthesis protein CobD n=1 Tax=Methanotorris igneus (strain DSM 5666 / JCM 11834 / Kol 5) TaxID=880724 RepID=F6BA66_METIK|nr:adenosylcobinamide-phosphate synthase CbiB [Methanotorris igneus]AEF95756.1 Cobalamin biosynthesis protein cbiB [Methanotorris igneus Kol 5]
MLNPLILFLVVVIDRIFGEPPEKIHPTVLIGKLIAFLEKTFPSSNSKNKFRDFVFGSLVVFTVIFVVFVISILIEKIINSIENEILKDFVYAVILSTTIGYRSLLEFSKKPIDYLKDGDLENARKYVQCIVSRDASKLDEEHVLSAAIESASENITDSIIAPLFYAVIFGLPGAFVYRAINTMDAMMGYKNSKYSYYGKVAARLDDLANLIPSRLAGILLILTAPLYNGDIKKAIYGFLKEGNKTPSPNSGYTMATLANALNITLEKIDHYKLGNGKITIKKSYKALKAIDIVVFVFLLFYLLLFIILM